MGNVKKKKKRTNARTWLLEIVGMNGTWCYLFSRMKISVSTDISVLRFYGYIGDISMNIFT